jgi:hypothetical protein
VLLPENGGRMPKCLEKGTVLLYTFYTRMCKCWFYAKKHIILYASYITNKYMDPVHTLKFYLQKTHFYSKVLCHYFPSTTRSSKLFLLLSKYRFWLWIINVRSLKGHFLLWHLKHGFSKFLPLSFWICYMFRSFCPYPWCNNCKYVRRGIQFMNLTI